MWSCRGGREQGQGIGEHGEQGDVSAEGLDRLSTGRREGRRLLKGSVLWLITPLCSRRGRLREKNERVFQCLC